MKEYEIIAKYFKPLAYKFAGSLNLEDDVAIFPKDALNEYVITTDSMVEGVHFFENSIAETVASRLLASNLSDIASSGAKPKFLTLNGTINSKTDENWIKSFAEKIDEISKEYGVYLVGGDTVKNDDKLFFAATIIGEIPKGRALNRNKAKIGDDIYVSGTIGEAFLGMQILKGEFEDLEQNDKNYFVNRYTSPTARVELGNELVNLANACADISDGFFIDLENICKSSSHSADVFINKIPIALNDVNLRLQQLTSGDDYELIFTANRANREDIFDLSKKLGLKISLVGKVKELEANNYLNILDENENFINLEKLGYQHEI